MDSLENHPIPQDVTHFQFRLIGDMTIKQFGYLGGGLGTAYFFLALPFPLVIKIILVPIFALLGIVLAFVPIEGRPADVMMKAFFHALFIPDQYIFKKSTGNQNISDLTQTMMITSPKPTTPAGNAINQQVTPPTPAPMPQQTVFTPVASTMPTPPPLQQAPVQSSQPMLASQPLPAPLPSPMPTNVPPPTPAPVSQPPPSNLPSAPTPPSVNQPEIKQEAIPTPQPAPISPTQQPVPQPPPPTQPQPTPIPNPTQESAAQYATQPAVGQPPSLKIPGVRSLGLPPSIDVPNLITGIVKDSRGNVLPNILIEVKDKDENPVRAFKTNQLGQFASATPLVNGTYTITFEDANNKHKFDTIKLTADGTILPIIEIISLDERENLRKELFG